MHRDTFGVLESYNKIADWFDAMRSRHLMEKPYLEYLTNNLKQGASILDLGCGTGEPVLRFLSSFDLSITGIDGSRAMIDKAIRRFPDITFLHEDMRDVSMNQHFDAIIAWHSLFHLPPADQRSMFDIFANHLKPNGLLLFTSGTEAGEFWSGDNGGERLYQASLSTEDYRTILTDLGFTVLKHVINDPACGGATIWLARFAPTT
ncbi:MAG: class I SAM-dependent methyltransferase [Bacteroidia bacterium]|nr:class I SAM-dependent methyltransferase [Bacteroidia bacterium]